MTDCTLYFRLRIPFRKPIVDDGKEYRMGKSWIASPASALSRVDFFAESRSECPGVIGRYSAFGRA